MRASLPPIRCISGRRDRGRHRRHQARGWSRARRRRTRSNGATHRPPHTGAPTSCSRRVAAAVRRPPRGHRSRRRVRRPDGRGRRGRLAAQHPGVARLPVARPPRRAIRRSRVGRQRRQGARARRGLDGRGRECDDYIGMVVSTGIGGGIVFDGRLLDGATATRATSATSIVEPDGHECACGARGCVEAEASGLGDRAHHRPSAARRTARGRARAPARSSGARSRRSRTCSTCRSRS